MKKKVLLPVLLVTALLFTGCASGYKNDTAAEMAPQYSFTEADSENGYYGGYDESFDYSSQPAETAAASGAPANTNEKIIYYLSATIETLKFDETLDAVDELIDRHKAFIESSSVTGKEYESYYYGTGSYRRANYVIRVPKDEFDLIKDELSTLGNVTGSNTSAQNITSQFIDTESRLKTYEIEESRLLSMLEKAETVADMITIETRLSEVRYNIESLTSQLNNWQHQVDYSTISLSIYEVKELSPEVAIPRTLGEEIIDALSKTFKGLVSFLQDFLVFFIAALPVLLLLAVIAIIVLLIVSKVKKRKSRTKNMYDPNNGQGRSDNNIH